MIFRMPQKNIRPPEIEIDNTKIELTTDFNFLGLIINQHLKWDSHINKIASKLNNILGVIYKLKDTVPNFILKNIYNALFLPHLNYGLKCWGFNSERIFKLQKKAIRLISFSIYNAHTEPLFKKQNLLKLEHIFELQILKFCYDLINHNLPPSFQTILDEIKPIQNDHNLRNKSNFRKYKVKHSFAKNALDTKFQKF